MDGWETGVSGRVKAAYIFASAVLLAGCGRSSSWPKAESGKRMIVLGVDGMDPQFVERHWESLPNLRKLRDAGGFWRLATTTPPQSPVAWSTFSTGLDPAQHGIFDFVHRDPETLQPMSSFAETLPPAHQLAIGPYLLPLSKGRVRSFRSGKTFWEILAGRGVPVQIIRMPANYPPVEHGGEHGGEQLAGMGTPDLEGTFGTFTFYSDDPLDIARAVPGGRIVPVAAKAGRVILPVEGPANPLRRDHVRVHVDMIADVDPTAGAARFRVDGQVFILKQGEWSRWIRVEFPLIPHITGVHGMFRLYVEQLHPGIRIYRSPLNVDPEEPALPISWPSSYSAEIAGRMGPFYTQGIEEDTAALRQGVLTLPEYLEQSRRVHAEHEALLRDSLAQFRRGLLFFYFSEIDQDSHMLWGRHEAELLRTYEAVDQSIGSVLAMAGEATVMVMSDHGFAAFDRAVNLNTWLWREEFLALNRPGDAGPDEMFAHVDWKRTQAYAMGLNALYVKAAGREKEKVIREIQQRLAAFTDPETGRTVVQSVARIAGASSRFAPDLIIGYAPGFRASWETSLGAVPIDVLQNNDDAWIGDHCIAAEAVPGVLVSNRRSRVADPGLKDLTVTILREFGVEAAPGMQGRAIY